MTKIWPRLELHAWNTRPSLIVLLLALVCLLPKYLSGFGQFMPMLPLIPIFFWAMYESRDIPYWVAFLIGFLMDAISGQPLGLSSLMNLFFMVVAHAQRKYIHKEGFVIQWGYFALIAASYQLATWTVLSLFIGQWLGFGSAFFQWVLTVCVYPPLHKLFERVNAHLHHRRWELIRSM
jgi:rod shape-determining protein MreD